MTFTILRQPRVLGTDKSFVTLKYNSECICKYLPEQDEIYTHVLEHRQSFNVIQNVTCGTGTELKFTIAK